MSIAIPIILCCVGIPVVTFALTLETSIYVERISANGNEFNHVSREIQYVAERIVAGVTDIDVKIEEGIPEDVIVKLKLSVPKLDEVQCRRILEAVGRYVRLRLDGHSKQFAIYLVLYGTQAWPVDLQALVANNSAVKEMIAFPWVNAQLRAPIAFPQQGESEKTVLYVIDGEIAWAYLISKKPGGNADNIVFFRFDAIEFSPGARNVMRRVFEEMRRENRVPTAGKPGPAGWWFEFRERLQRETGIRWRTPVELNPEVQFD